MAFERRARYTTPGHTDVIGQKVLVHLVEQCPTPRTVQLEDFFLLHEFENVVEGEQNHIVEVPRGLRFHGIIEFSFDYFDAGEELHFEIETVIVVDFMSAGRRPFPPSGEALRFVPDRFEVLSWLIDDLDGFRTT